MSECLRHELVFCVASASHNLRLQYLVPPTEVSDGVSSLKAVFNRHLAVHEYQPVAMSLVFVAFLNQLECLKTVLGSISRMLDSFEALDLLQDDLKPYYVERLIIDYHDPPCFVDPLEHVLRDKTTLWQEGLDSLDLVREDVHFDLLLIPPIEREGRIYANVIESGESHSLLFIIRNNTLLLVEKRHVNGVGVAFIRVALHYLKRGHFPANRDSAVFRDAVDL